MKKYHLKSFEALSVVSFVVDVNGMPQNICVAKRRVTGLIETRSKPRQNGVSSQPHAMANRCLFV